MDAQKRRARALQSMSVVWLVTLPATATACQVGQLLTEARNRLRMWSGAQRELCHPQEGMTEQLRGVLPDTEHLSREVG